MSASHTQTDILIIGSGAAGLTVALDLARHHRVTVLAKSQLTEGNTLYAQGGVSAVLDDKDSFESHIRDTQDAGAGLCHDHVVRHTVERGPEAIERLIERGVAFSRHTKTDGQEVYHLTREGGHSHRRVIHSADATGRAIETTLVEQARANPNITLLERQVAIDLITHDKLRLDKPRCYGAWVYDRDRDQVQAIGAQYVVLATGGAAKVYLYTSNPDISTGDGIAMAWRAGCRVANMEFIQFHPTCLYHPHAKSFLITEALRGEGAQLLLPDGERFMQRFDPRGELAPRDIVARAIDHEMKRLGIDNVYLDISFRSPEFIQKHFPTVYQRCQHYGIDITTDPIPVVPAAHYTCGGVVVDQQGRSDLPGLYAVGETAFTGLHGANRMASNSLLECLVYGQAVGDHIHQHIHQQTALPELPAWDESQVTEADEEIVVTHNWDELRRFMWDYVGIVRTNKRLQRAQNRIDLLRQEIDEFYANFRVHNDLLELRNLVTVAQLIIRAAQQRRESRGLHYTLDYPKRDDQHPPRDTILVPANYAGRQQHPGWPD